MPEPRRKITVVMTPNLKGNEGVEERNRDDKKVIHCHSLLIKFTNHAIFALPVASSSVPRRWLY
jgi:hypothetical protein